MDRRKNNVDQSSNDVEAEVMTRMARQAAMLDREKPPWLFVLIEEAAIEIEIGGRRTMHEQLHHLLKMDEFPFSSVRIIPKTAGAHPGADGPFRVISMESRDIAYAGAQLGGRLLEEPLEVQMLTVFFDRIGRKALSEDESRARIERQLEAYSP